MRISDWSSDVCSSDLAAMLFRPAADLDPKAFAKPDSYDLDRENNTHIACNAGVHRCLGSHLARVELQVCYEEVLQHFLASGARRAAGLLRGSAEAPANVPSRSGQPADLPLRPRDRRQLAAHRLGRVGMAGYNTSSTRPQPRLDADNRAFWTGGENGALFIHHCADCGGYVHPPRP